MSMELFSYLEENNSDNVEVVTSKGFINLNNMIGKEIDLNMPKSNYGYSDEIPVKRKRGKNDSEVVVGSSDRVNYSIGDQYESLEGESGRPLGYLEKNIDIRSEYSETNALLRSSIHMLDNVVHELKDDINTIRSMRSKVEGGKYKSLSEMTATITNAINGKVAAIRELNNSIKTTHDIELKRAKETKHLNETDDNKAILDAYRGIINTPINSSVNSNEFNPFQFKTIDAIFPGSNMMYRNSPGRDDIFNNYLGDLKPEQKLMLYEGNPNVKETVVIDANTYEKTFKWIDHSTMEIIDGLPQKSTDMFMPDTAINMNTMTARNPNLEETYPVIYAHQIRSGNQQNDISNRPIPNNRKYDGF